MSFPEKPLPRQQPHSPRQPGVRLRVEKIRDKALQTQLIYANVAGVSYRDFAPSRDGTDINILIRARDPVRGTVRENVVRARPTPELPEGTISLSDPQRQWLKIGMTDTFEGEVYDASRQGATHLEAMDLELSWASMKRDPNYEFTHEYLAKVFERFFQMHFFAPGQRTLLDIEGLKVFATVKTITFQGGRGPEAVVTTSDPSARGFYSTATLLSFFKAADSELKLQVGEHQGNANPIISPDFKFEDMGIGGLHDEFSTIFRRAFASRVFPPQLVAKLGIQHVKGILLFGPPGTGKTLIARQIGKMLNAREPKIINGPEVLNKFVGQSEENIRKMFADAEKEYKEKGDQSGLHIIIFDELDAVCKQRGSGAGGGTGVGDSVVNQLLTKLDGVDQLNNILLIGMTNRKDMIDEALLRPGRLEVQLEISLPNEEGRKEIFMIHTAKMRDNNIMDPKVDVASLAARTKNYSGAEISGVVKAATSFAFNRHTEVGNSAKMKSDVSAMKITMDDFENALIEVKPAYGVSEDEISNALGMGILQFNDNIPAIIRTMMGYIDTVKESDVLTRIPVLLHGPPESGKTALAAHTASLSDFPFVKLVSPQHLTAFRDEFGKKDYLTKVFTDAYKSERSIVILDNFEQLIEWNPIGPRFSNTGRRILIMVTTSERFILSNLGVLKHFRRQIPVPAVSDVRELASVLDQTGMFGANDVQAVIGSIQNDTRSEKIGLGIKTILESIEESKVEASSQGTDMLESVANRIVTAISSNALDG
ncbi:ATPase [Colletotrichum higginsianum]|uniref:Vesicular-fusion protein SEC18 n=1 Tax=Colletotrichum higginsianum (strain IMI 349063) TaxID=759273 RepID=H1UVG2_COLHI|nr:ATPase [Colletotrichum higginsianum IMI 349063]OBR06783.1 ATPase [Colletotrichum higginsianum IMI 349063]CCF31963.1 ATPase [Colletotrichum higginsianum]